MRRLRRWLCNISPRYKLRCICKAIGIEPYPFQRRYALTGEAKFPPGRCTGKTMAVMLHLLMMGETVPDGYVILTLWDDPDWRPRDVPRVICYEQEYQLLAFKCIKAGIPVRFQIDYRSLGRRT